MDEGTDHIEDLEQRLYARDPERVPQRKYGILRPIKQNVSSSWGEGEVPRNHTIHRTNITGYRRFFIVALIFFLLALGAALFSYYKGAVTLSSKNVEVTILGNSFVGGGEDLPIQVEIANKNSSDLIDASLAIDYPKGATDQTGADMMHLVKQLGTIPSGKTKSEEFSVVLYGEQGTAREIKATLTYKIGGSSAQFQKEETFAVMVNSSPFALTVDGPTAIGANQSFTLTVRNVFNGDKPLSGVLARVEYPTGFVYQSSTPAPLSGNNVWDMGDMSKGSEKTIAIRGRIVGEQNDEKSFRVYVGARESDTDNRIAVTYNSALHTAVITQPFISGTIAVNGQTTDVIAIPVGNAVNGVVSWTNNAATAITNPVFTLSLQGDSIDQSSVFAEHANYDPVNHTLTWTSANNADLKTLDPGARGQFNFTFDTQQLERDTSDITLDLSVRGTFPDNNYQEASLSNIDEKIVRFASRLQFAAQSLYSVGAIKNTGPFPPKADKETTYTIVWTARPTDNPISNVRATATLPDGVQWSGVIVPQTAPVTYNPDTRTVSWSVGSLPRATSTPVSKSVSFQVKVKPTKSQVGSSIDLLNETTVTATDAVANVPLTITRQPLSTRLDSDPNYTPGQERVIP